MRTALHLIDVSILWVFAIMCVACSAILRGFITNKIALLEAQLRTGVKASTLKSQTYLNKQVVDGASVIAAAKGVCMRALLFTALNQSRWRLSAQ